MKFKTFLLEYKKMTETDFIEAVIQDCKPALSEIMSGDDKYLYRSVSDELGRSNWFEETVRKDRHPLDTPERVHNIIDNWFLKKFGYKYRSASLFVSTNYEMIFSFSDVTSRPTTNIFYIIPKGSYKLCYSQKTKDLYIDWLLNVTRWTNFLCEKKSELYYLKILFDDETLSKISSSTYKKILRELIMLVSHGIIPTHPKINNGDDIDIDIEFDKDSAIKFQETVIIDLLDELEYIETTKFPRNNVGEIMLQCDQYYATRHEGPDTMGKICYKLS